MARRRIARLNEQLKREITRILRSEVRDPRIDVVTLTGVDVSNDLSVARVYVNLKGDEGERAATLEGLRAAAPYIRGMLGRELRLRRMPELRFLEDETLDRAMRIERLIDQVRSADASESDPADDRRGDGG